MCNYKKKMKLLTSVICLILFIITSMGTAYAEVSYEGYNYDYWEKSISSPIAYEPIMSISGRTAGTTDFSLPSDIYVTANGDIYICDSGNNRIVVLNKELKLKKVIDGFDNNGKTDSFNNPQGIYVTHDNKLYVADTGNKRVVEITDQGRLAQLYQVEKDETLPDNFVFEPVKVGVDKAGRVYVIARNIFEGMLSFTPDGKYAGYFGTIKVTVGIADRFWRMLATQEQRSKMKLYVPTEFSNLDIDDEGFVYTTDIDYDSTQSIKRFNPSGKNVIKNINVANNKDRPKSAQKKDLIGDLMWPDFGIYSGRSSLVDIEYRGSGMYSVLDSKRGRIFTYDNEGNILYIFSGIGTQLGMLKKPVSIESFEDRIYVLDQARSQLVMYRATEYGSLINKAISLRYNGDEGAAVECWKQVLKMDANCRLANVGIGKSLLAENKNKEAMYYLEKGMDKINYSVAFKRYRTDVLKIYFPYILGAIVLLIIVIQSTRLYKRWRRGKCE